jgi:hypothetical protein
MDGKGLLNGGLLAAIVLMFLQGGQVTGDVAVPGLGGGFAWGELIAAAVAALLGGGGGGGIKGFLQKILGGLLPKPPAPVPPPQPTPSDPLAVLVQLLLERLRQRDQSGAEKAFEMAELISMQPAEAPKP